LRKGLLIYWESYAQAKLDEYYIIEKLGAYCNYPILERTLKRDLGEPQKQEVIQIAKTIEHSSANCLISMYLLTYELISNGNDTVFEKARQYFQEHATTLPIEERKFAFFSLFNYSAIQRNAGRISFHRTSFDLNQLGLEQEVYFANGFMTGTSFINIVLNSLGIKEFDWIESLANQYKDRIIPRERISAYKLSMGFLHFHFNQYQECIDITSNFESSKINDILSAKLLSLRSYFSLCKSDSSYLDLFNSTERNFYKFIKRSSLSTQNQKIHLSFLKYIKQLSTFSSSVNKSLVQLELIELEIQNTSNLVLKKWLLNTISNTKQEVF